jgi:hypothetical protein
LRGRLAPGGPASRPPGTTTRLRGARSTGSGGTVEGSAGRVKNRHGGAPRGERPASWDAGRLASAWRQKRAAGTRWTEIGPASAVIVCSALSPELGLPEFGTLSRPKSDFGCERAAPGKRTTCGCGKRSSASGLLFQWMAQLRRVERSARRGHEARRQDGDGNSPRRRRAQNPHQL